MHINKLSCILQALIRNTYIHDCSANRGLTSHIYGGGGMSHIHPNVKNM